MGGFADYSLLGLCTLPALCAEVAAFARPGPELGASYFLGWALTLFLCLTFGALLLVLLVRRGTSPGAALLGYNIHREGDPRSAPGLKAAAIRLGMGAAGAFIMFGMGAVALAVSIVVDPRRRGLHDKLSGTAVSRPVDPGPASTRRGGGASVAQVPVAKRTLAGRPPSQAEASEQRGVDSGAPAIENVGPDVSVGRLWFDDGRCIELPAGVEVVVGRRPAIAGAQVARTFLDETFSMSKTHAIFTVTTAGTQVRDAGSTNGTFLVSDNGSLVPVGRAQSKVVSNGTVLRFGERSATLEWLTGGASDA